MRFTRTIYPDYPGAQGSPCWNLQGRWLWADADWNTRRPFGACMAARIGPRCRSGSAPGFTLDLNPPEGEPNRLYLWLGNWHVILGLPSVREFRETGRERTVGRNGKEITVVHGEHFSNWLHPHIDGCDRYRYHQNETGRWVRNGKPEPLYWGWLTIERRRG